MMKPLLLSLLPEPEHARRISQALAMLDAVLMPKWNFRFFSFEIQWNSHKNESMASARDGSGNEQFAIFRKNQAIIKGYEHESTIGDYLEKNEDLYFKIIDQIPMNFFDFRNEKAFDMEHITYIMWFDLNFRWECPDVHGSNLPLQEESPYFLRFLVSGPSFYHNWAQEYYGRNLPLETIVKVFNHEPLTSTMVYSLNDNINLQNLNDDIKKIGYPKIG